MIVSEHESIYYLGTYQSVYIIILYIIYQSMDNNIIIISNRYVFYQIFNVHAMYNDQIIVYGKLGSNTSEF